MLRVLRHQAVLPILAFYLYLSGSAPFLGQWDSFDYLKQIVTHQLSALGIGRPVYLGYNILLWESLRSIFHLDPLRVEIVAMAETVLFGVWGVWLFQKLARRLLPSPASQMAVVAFAISPVYALYSGFIMTEVPMLAVLLAAALVLWNSKDRHPLWSDLAGGILFGLAIGIREQALTLGAAFLWILWSRRPTVSKRLRSMVLFCVAAGIIAIAPAIIFYLCDPAGFLARIQTWLHAIPMGAPQFRNNMEASLLYTFVICPGAWFAIACAGVYRFFRKKVVTEAEKDFVSKIPNPVLGVICCLVLPVVILWRDADVQMHPRYVLLVLPASLILCAAVFRRWIPSGRGLAVWAIIQILFFGAALAVLSPYRQTQTKKIEFARVMRDSIPDGSLIIAGNYSPILDYYRGIGVRPGWQILWSGWDWDAKAAETRIQGSLAQDVPVYWSTDPVGWSYFEGDLLDLHIMLKDYKRELVVPNLYRIYLPKSQQH